MLSKIWDYNLFVPVQRVRPRVRARAPCGACGRPLCGPTLRAHSAGAHSAGSSAVHARLRARWAGAPGAYGAPARADAPGVRACNQAPVCAMARQMSHLARHARACENFAPNYVLTQNGSTYGTLSAINACHNRKLTPQTHLRHEESTKIANTMLSVRFFLYSSYDSDRHKHLAVHCIMFSRAVLQACHDNMSTFRSFCCQYF